MNFINNLKKLLNISEVAPKIIEPMLILSFFVAIYRFWDRTQIQQLLKALYLDPGHTMLISLETLAVIDDWFTVYIVLLFTISMYSNRKIELSYIMASIWGNLQMIILIFVLLWSPFFDFGQYNLKTSVDFLLFIIISVSVKVFFANDNPVQ